MCGVVVEVGWWGCVGLVRGGEATRVSAVGLVGWSVWVAWAGRYFSISQSSHRLALWMCAVETGTRQALDTTMQFTMT